MAIELSRTGWMQAFEQRRAPNGFLTSFFKARPGSFYKGKKVAIDIKRVGESVAVAVKDCTGPNGNKASSFTTKEFTPPAYDESFPLDICDLLNRMVGVDPFSAADVEYSAQLNSELVNGSVYIMDKITRAVELQASQILQTGELDLINSAGDTVYEIDFMPKASHFPTVGSTWAGVSDKLGDLEALAKVIRGDGKVVVNTAIFGSNALKLFLADSEVKDRLNNRRMELGQISPEMLASGATYYGSVWVGTYALDIWCYPDVYDHPQTGVSTEYVDANKVILLSDKTELTITSAVVPTPLPDPRVAGMLPGRLMSREQGFDVTPNVYASENGKQVQVELESRPLLVPTQIDGFGCLTVIV